MKNIMNKKINIFLAGVLCSLGVMAQEDTLIVRQNDEVVEMGRTITMDAREMTGAVSVTTNLSHKNSIKPVRFGRMAQRCIYVEIVL